MNKIKNTNLNLIKKKKNTFLLVKKMNFYYTPFPNGNHIFYIKLNLSKIMKKFNE